MFLTSTRSNKHIGFITSANEIAVQIMKNIMTDNQSFSRQIQLLLCVLVGKDLKG